MIKEQEQEIITPLITLEQAKQLVKLLENKEYAQADNLVLSLAVTENNFRKAVELDGQLFEQIGKLTRQLHTSLTEFQLDARISDMAKFDIPDAASRLTYVIEVTEQAANKTMDAVEASLPVVDELSSKLSDLQQNWQPYFNKRNSLTEFKDLCRDTYSFTNYAISIAKVLSENLRIVLMAQDFQDLTGQVIRRVIQLVQEVEDSLINMLQVFGEPELKETEEPVCTIVAEGPIINAQGREDIAHNQDDVDELLSSLGF